MNKYSITSEELEQQIKELGQAIKIMEAYYKVKKLEYELTGIVPEGFALCPICNELVFIDADHCPKCNIKFRK